MHEEQRACCRQHTPARRIFCKRMHVAPWLWAEVLRCEPSRSTWGKGGASDKHNGTPLVCRTQRRSPCSARNSRYLLGRRIITRPSASRITSASYRPLEYRHEDLAHCDRRMARSCHGICCLRRHALILYRGRLPHDDQQRFDRNSGDHGSPDDP